MNDFIHELGSLCKVAAELERQWDRAGRGYLGTQVSTAEYAASVEQYLRAVRRLEAALSHHLVALTAEAAQARKRVKEDGDGPDYWSPAS